MESQRELRVLEFTKIREQLIKHCVTDLGKDVAANLVPQNNMDSVNRNLNETEEAVVLLTYNGISPIVHFEDITQYLSLAKKGATLTTTALLHISSCLRATSTAQKYLSNNNDNTPLLTICSNNLTTLFSVEKDINTAIIAEDEIADNASAELAQIRRQIRNANSKIRDKLNSIIHSQGTSKFLQDSIITIRNGRYCVPVKAEYRANFSGLVHDQSSSGATMFIEPMSVVELGNDIKQFKTNEQIEIQRILKALTQRITPYIDEMYTNVETLAHLDFVFAKAILAKEMHACLPRINNENKINIIRARHPLIQRDKVVPISLWIGEEFDSLIITGPNTGGKTVTLKTVGLLTLMAQAGLHVPADYGTQLAVFNKVHVDIGDEQSIEQSLSTFSSHMKNIVEIMNTVTNKDLALFDELGAGTDPTEGAALAQTILNRLKQMNVTTVATTHYSELKAYALSTNGVENASVEFDLESLKPTYRLSIGIPGKSNAFEISRKLGLSDEIIEASKELLSKNDIRFEDVIANAEYHRQVAQKEKTLAIQAHNDTLKLQNEADKLRTEIQNSKEKYIKKAKEEAKRILENARNESDIIISEIKKMKKNAQVPQHEIQELKKRMDRSIGELNEELLKPTQLNFTPPKSVKIGQTVEIVHLNTIGTVLTQPNNKGELMVQAGIMKLSVHLSQLKIAKETSVKKTNVNNKTNSLARSVQSELDIRGYALDEAIPEVDVFLDNATLAGLNEVSIIHGKGTGILRNGIHQHLKKHMHVNKYRLGVYGEGESGVTIVTLK